MTVRSSNYHDSNGKVSVDNIPLGKIDGYFVPSKETEQFEFDIKEFEQVNQRFTRAFSATERNGTMLRDTKRAIDILEGGKFYKWFNRPLSSIPNSLAKELRSALESVEGNVGMDELVTMKES